AAAVAAIPPGVLRDVLPRSGRVPDRGRLVARRSALEALENALLVGALAPAPAVELRDEDAADRAARERQQDDPDERHARRAEDEVDRHVLAVLEDECDEVCRDRDERDPADV